MKIGISTYCFNHYLESGEMSLHDVIEWAAEHDCEHVEIEASKFDPDEKELDDIRSHCDDLGLEISSYTFGADFGTEKKTALRKEIDRVKKKVDQAAALGVEKVRHDVAWREPEDCGLEEFEALLPQLADACRKVADHAAQYGIVTSSENHGFFVQNSDRLGRLILAVGRENYAATLDIGNFVMVHEDPLGALYNLLPYTSHIHLKDFHIKERGALDPGEGWISLPGFRYIRGAIFGHGDLDMNYLLLTIYGFGYPDCLSLEFEGMEEPRLGTRIGLENVRSCMANIRKHVVPMNEM